MSENKMNRRPQQRRRGPGGPGPGGPMGIVEKPKNFKGTLKQLAAYMKPYHLKLLISFVFAIVGTVFSIFGPKILGNATTEIFEGVVRKISGTGGIDFGYIGQIIGFLLALYVVSMLFSAVQGFILARISQDISYNFRTQLAKKINRLPLNYFDKMSHGEVLSRVTNDVDTIEQSFRQTLAQLVTSVTTVLGVLIMMLSISPLMTAVAVLILPMSLIVVMFIVKKSQKYFKQQQEYLGHINGQVEEVYGGLSIVKAFNAEEQYLHEFNKYNDVLYSSAWKSQMMSGIMMPAMNFIGNIGYVVVSILGSYLAIKKVIQVGDILSFLQYVRNLTNPIAQTAQVANALQSTIAAAERVFEFLNEEEEIPETQTPAAITNINGNVSFDHVRFGYKSDKIVIKDFSADIKQGQKIAIVGPTGAGKTTIVKLLMRFYELNSGSILVDGINIKDFKREDLRNLFGMVLQDTWLFNGTIMENIRYGNMNATDEEVKKAADSAYADHFIRALPNSYQMVLNEEASNISQGQKQLLTIARAILANPKILILDEATSSVDTRTEVLIQKAMAKLMKGRTNFIIAHRLSTIRDADMILVMNEGDIVEQGSHTELLQRNGFYAKLYNSQFDAGEEAS